MYYFREKTERLTIYAISPWAWLGAIAIILLGIILLFPRSIEHRDEFWGWLFVGTGCVVIIVSPLTVVVFDKSNEVVTIRRLVIWGFHKRVYPLADLKKLYVEKFYIEVRYGAKLFRYRLLIRFRGQNPFVLTSIYTSSATEHEEFIDRVFVFLKQKYQLLEDEPNTN